MRKRPRFISDAAVLSEAVDTVAAFAGPDMAAADFVAADSFGIRV
jgi:hypothetical protein